MRILRGLEPAVEACQHLLIDEIMAARLCAQPRIARLQPFLPRLFMTAHPDHFTRNMMIRAKAQHLRSGIGVPVAMIKHAGHIQLLQLEDEGQEIGLDPLFHLPLMRRSLAAVFQLQQQLITREDERAFPFGQRPGIRALAAGHLSAQQIHRAHIRISSYARVPTPIFSACSRQVCHSLSGVVLRK